MNIVPDDPISSGVLVLIYTLNGSLECEVLEAALVADVELFYWHGFPNVD